MSNSSTSLMNYSNLPGWELVNPGLCDIAAGNFNTINALLVLMAAPRLKRCGLKFPDVNIKEIHLVIYSMLRCRGGDAYSQYASLLRRLAKFCSALEKMSDLHESAYG